LFFISSIYPDDISLKDSGHNFLVELSTGLFHRKSKLANTKGFQRENSLIRNKSCSWTLIILIISFQ